MDVIKIIGLIIVGMISITIMLASILFFMGRSILNIEKKEDVDNNCDRVVRDLLKELKIKVEKKPPIKVK